MVRLKKVKAGYRISGLLMTALLSVCVIAAEEHQGEHGSRMLEISDSLAREYGISTAVAAPGEIRQTLLFYGRTEPDPQQISHITARYPGMILSIGPALGDSVDAGEVIAQIESNNNLQDYDIRAPISGIVVSKHANPGEITGNDPLLTIANYDRLWVDLSVFPGDAARVRGGQPVTITMSGMAAESTISYLNPGEGDTPAVIARVPVDNTELNWTPGLLVEGYVEIARNEVALRVERRALQELEGEQVVFTREGEHYRAQSLRLGRRDRRYVEVLDGLAAGDEYVVESSYVLKADLEKDGATHSH